MFCRSAPTEGTVRSSTKIDIDIIKVAHDVLVRAPSWHYQVLRRVDVLFAVDDDVLEVCVAKRLQPSGEIGTETRSRPIEPVANFASAVESPVA